MTTFKLNITKYIPMKANYIVVTWVNLRIIPILYEFFLLLLNTFFF